MPIYTAGAFRDPYTQADIPASAGAVRRATFEQAASDLLAPSIFRALELNIAEKHGAMYGYRRYDPAQSEAFMDANGLAGQFKFEDREYNQLELSILARRKTAELKRQAILSRAEGSGSTAIGRFGISLATSFLDPLTVGTAFVPVIGPSKYAAMLEKAGASALTRAGVRARVGALEGAVGAAAVEPIIYGAHAQEQADYTLADSLLNIGIGTAFGGGLHTVGGAVADALARTPEARSAHDFPLNAEQRELRAQIPSDASLRAGDRVIESDFADQIARDYGGEVGRYSALEDTAGGKILSVDTARELSPDYLRDRTKSAAVHEPASWFIKRLYAEKLAEAPKAGEESVVLFMAGGTGAGKTSTLNRLIPGQMGRAQIIYDTNMNGLDSSMRKIEQALAADKGVIVTYVYRDPVEALKNGALTRAMRQEGEHGSGRTVPLPSHLETHFGARETIEALAAKYADDSRVKFSFVDNSRGRDNAAVVTLAEIPKLPREGYNSVRENALNTLEAARADGRISEAVYRGFRDGSQGSPSGGSPPGAGGRDRPRAARQPPAQLDEGLGGLEPAASRVAAADPRIREAALRSAVAQAVTGEPIEVRPVFDPATMPDAARRLADPDQRPLADPAAVERADTVLAAGESAELASVQRELADLTAEVESMLDELDLGERDKELADSIRAELAESREAVAEVKDLARVASLLATCAMRHAP
jgi:hypothetical protein